MEEEKHAPRGEYRTKSQTAVKDLMQKEGDRHMTAEEVHRILAEQGFKIGLTTVYRQLDKLVEEGTVRKISGDRMGSCYQNKTCHAKNCYHLICTSCGKLQHLSCESAERLLIHIREEHGFTVDPGRTVLYGLCRECAEKKTKNIEK